MAKPVFATNDVPTATQFNEWLVNVNFARRTSTASISSSTTLTDDSQLFVPVQINAVYTFLMWLQYDGPTAADLKWQINVPSGASFAGHSHGLIPTAASQQDFQGFPVTHGSANTWGCLGGSATGLLFGAVITGGTAGNVQLSWAQNTSNATAVRIFAPSFMRLDRVE